jgi:hypothetical protein
MVRPLKHVAAPVVGLARQNQQPSKSATRPVSKSPNQIPSNLAQTLLLQQHIPFNGKRQTTLSTDPPTKLFLYIKMAEAAPAGARGGFGRGRGGGDRGRGRRGPRRGGRKDEEKEW